MADHGAIGAFLTPGYNDFPVSIPPVWELNQSALFQKTNVMVQEATRVVSADGTSVIPYIILGGSSSSPVTSATWG